MNRIVLHLTVITLCVSMASCSQVVAVQQPAQNAKQAVLGSIDFGTSPVWREADTTVSLKLKSQLSKVNILILDSNWTLQSSSIVDSNLTLSILYQPMTIEDHHGYVFVLGDSDTIAALTLLGKTSTFERHVGDSYIFQDGVTSKVDSVWIKSLQLVIQTSDSSTTGFDDLLRSAEALNSGDWSANIQTFNSGRYHYVIPFESKRPFDSIYNTEVDGDSSTLYVKRHQTAIIGDTLVRFFGHQVPTSADAVELKGTDWQKGEARQTGGHGFESSGTFSGEYTYIPNIGMFSKFSGLETRLYPNNPNTWITTSAYRLIRFHLKR